MDELQKRIQDLPPKHRALLALEDMRSKLDAFERSQNEPIAVTGCSCRFPGGITEPESFWRLLREGRDGISDVPPDRWNLEEFYDPELSSSGTMNTRWGGFLDGIDQFDPEFFGVSLREASALDPQQRLLLEVSWEALERAGQAPDRLAGTQTGVFVGISSWDYSNLLLEAPPRGGTGLALSIAANRLSYFYDFHGPSVALDTACSSSLVTVDLACQSLRSGVCDLALAGGVNVILSPLTTVAFSQAGMMASDGRCKTFDASANGYVRSEGCGIVVLKRLSEAVRDRDHIMGVILGSAVNHDGRSNGLTAPNGLSQQTLIRRALKNARVAAKQVGYIEAHGTGTSLGDAVEVESVWQVIREGRADENPCWLGSVKTNLGHLEAAAGVAGLIKVLLALENEHLPAHLNFKEANPNLNLDQKPSLKIAADHIAWRRGEQARIAGVSSFGFGGTNAHVVVTEAPLIRASEVPGKRERGQHILALSAKTPRSLRELARRFATHMEGSAPDQLPDICYTANSGRAHFDHRLAVQAASANEFRVKLSAFANGEDGSVYHGVLDTPDKLTVAFLFAGEGPLQRGIGRDLFETELVFRDAMQKCSDLLREDFEQPLIEVLYGESQQQSDFVESRYERPASFAYQYALVEQLASWGLRPSVVLGREVGEYVAACTAGVFTLEDAIVLSVGGKQIPDWQRRLSQVRFRSPALPMVSSVTARVIEPTAVPDAEYWREQTMHTALFEAGIQTVYGMGCRVFVEISPAMQPMSLGAGQTDRSVLITSPKEGGDTYKLLDMVARLYVRGGSVNWAGLDGAYSRKRVVLPTYPFERRRCWLDSSEVRRFSGPLQEKDKHRVARN